MNIFHRVTLQSLKKNRTRTVVTIIGIMLSTALICAVTTSVASFLNYAKESAIYFSGSWHGSCLSTTYAEYEEIRSADKVKSAVYGGYCGYAALENCDNEYKPYLYLMYADKAFADTLSVHLISGEYPDAPDEILLPEHLAENGGVHYELGDTITLDIGDRMLEGYPCYQSRPNYFYEYDPQNGENTVLNGEILEIRETASFTVAGFYERPEFEEYTAPGYTALLLPPAQMPADSVCDVYFTMKNASDIYDFMEDQGLSGATNYDLLLFSGVSKYDSFHAMVFSLTAIVIGLIMFGSISLIYNAFAISVSERTKQFGLLSSIGATRKQLRHMVLFEAFTVSAIGIPLGILLGIAGIGITLQLIGDRFTSLSNIPIPMRVCVSPAAILIACIVAIVTVLLSAWIPSRRATKVSAVEAIRQSMDIKGKNKPIRTPKLIVKLFGLPGMLAHKHFKRSKKKYRATIVSLFMSIVLFVSASSFTSYLTNSVEGSFSTYGFDLEYDILDEEFGSMDRDSLLTLIENEETVEKAAYARILSRWCSISAAYLSEQVQDKEKEYLGFYETESGETYADIHARMYFVDDVTFRELLRAEGLREEDYMNPEAPLALVYDKTTGFDTEAEKYRTIEILSGDSCTLVNNEYREYEGYFLSNIEDEADGSFLCIYENIEDPMDTFTIPEEEAKVTYALHTGKRLEKAPYFVAYTMHTALIYPYSLYETMDAALSFNSNPCSYHITTDDHAECYEALKKTLDDNGMPYKSLYNYAEGVEETRNVILIVKVFSYGFIVLISLIAAANVFNTISTNLHLRRREFAMLRSIGMTDRAFRGMMNFECLLYGSKALLYGLPAACGVTYLIYLSIMEGFEMNFYIPWSAIGIAVLSVFLVVSATMLYSMSKIRKDNPVETLRNENI